MNFLFLLCLLVFIPKRIGEICCLGASVRSRGETGNRRRGAPAKKKIGIFPSEIKHVDTHMDGKWMENGGKHYEIFTYKSGWWQLKDFFIFTQDPWGFMIQFDQ